MQENKWNFSIYMYKLCMLIYRSDMQIVLFNIGLGLIFNRFTQIEYYFYISPPRTKRLNTPDTVR